MNHKNDIYQISRQITEELSASGKATGPGYASDTVRHLYFCKRHPGFDIRTTLSDKNGIAEYRIVTAAGQPVSAKEWLTRNE